MRKKEKKEIVEVTKIELLPAPAGAVDNAKIQKKSEVARGVSW